MSQPVVKRASEPQVVQWIWGAISAIRSQKQVANEDRILRHISREHGEEASQAASKQIHLAVDDGLIVEYRAPVQKAGAMFGAEQEAYRLPEDDIINGDHDWYCFECHHPGEVLECLSCWRVFHPNCIRYSINSEFICPVCKDTEKPSAFKPKELNQMLSFTVLRLKEKSTALHWFGGAELGLDRFVHHYLDLNIIQTRTHDRYYTSLEQLFGDVCTIRHNIFVCFGENGVLQDMARVMLRDCQYDLDEIRQCRDCYLHSNIKNKDWFCQPCRVPHDLVFAKQKGFGYWPAKVIKVSEEGYDVRFFGARHQRAMIPSGNVRPADTDLHALGVKRTAGFVRACNEMARHQELVQQVALKGFDKFSSMHYDKNDVRCKSANDSDDAIDQNGSKVSTASDRDDDDDDDDDDDSIPTAVPRRRAPKKPRRSSQVRRRRTSTSSKTSHSKTRCSVEEPSVVSSSEDRNRNVKSVTCTDACVQTIKLLPMAGECVTVNHGTQTDNDSSSTCTADCEARFEVKFRDLRARVEHELNEQMQVATKKLEERLRKEFEEDQQRAVQRALSNSARSTEMVRQQTEKDCREQFDEEMKRVLQKQAADISTVKKKQWCYNCESEAMYHCCWNTSYCSIKCQQEHWHREHKRVCRRKRP